MPNNQYYLSFCIPVYNEEKIIHSKIIEIKKSLERILKKKSYEILIVENGSTDNTLKELGKFTANNLKVITLKEKGHGLAMETAIFNTRAEYVLLTAIDLPFGFSDLKEMLKIADRYDIIFGSKSHPQSITYSPFIRKVTSKIYRQLLKIFFNTKVGDTQGTVFLRREVILPLLKYCDSQNAFFSAQLAIFSERFSLKVVEVPVKNDLKILRKSKYNVFSDGSKMLISLFKTYLNIKVTDIKRNTLSR
ncbi:MAG: glycosyltransferase family 2 protein [Candidatus Levyibacteriota bacterium]|jgi:dolichyl-phosphate beta-glucosyltransferase